MEFSFDIERVLPGRLTVIVVSDFNSGLLIYDLESKGDKEEASTSWAYNFSANTPWDLKLKKRKEDLASVIDQMGLASAEAQNLRTPITSLKKLLNSSKQKIYTIRDVNEPRCIIGMLKVGYKRLFVCDDIGAHHEVDPLCILDFYVHESKQRCGFGHELFDAMLLAENISPEKLAIDRPSYKCLAFLQKHYGLKDHIVQTNNYVIFPGFFIDMLDTRPPIFLYSRKALEKPVSNTEKQLLNQSRANIKNEIDALNSVKLSLQPSELKKNKTYYSYSAGNCLMWDDSSENEKNQRKHLQKQDIFTSRETNNPNKNTDGKNWGVHDAMHSYIADNKEAGDWSASHLTHCSLTPINNVSNSFQRKWNQRQSSWNVLGVKPVEYSLFQKHT